MRDGRTSKKGRLRAIRTSYFLILCGIVCQGISTAAPSESWLQTLDMANGSFEPTWESLERYECPEWFRDAKFGIWAIIGPQCVPMQGDWYARHMYIEGHRQYEHHVKTYGHPSKFGYKDLIARFNPTELDYDRLVGLYKLAGAKYAVILAVHHDNFDLWNSQHHEWNSVKKGPRRDLVGEFRAATREHDLRFGVTTHLARTYSWLQTSHGADKEGPLAGVPYDGANPKYQSLYHPPFAESPRYPSNPPEAWQRQWYLRVQDLIDQYQPDLMYFDGSYPFDDGAVGRRLVAHYYNTNSDWHDGRNEAAMCIKKWPPDSHHGMYRDGTCVQDIERGAANELRELPWQTDTCIGGWYYRGGLRYKTVSHVAHMLVDIVSKNGNLLLNIPLHPSGAIDADEEAFLKGMGQWMAVNGAGIYETRPWVVYGEGPTTSSGGHFNEKQLDYSPADFRFTAKGDSELNAFFMAWPQDNKLVIRSLARDEDSRARIESVRLLGHDAPLVHQRTAEGLVVTLPSKRPCEHAWALRIQGRNLTDFDVTALNRRNERARIESRLIKPEGDSITLFADKAQIHGASPRLEKKPSVSRQNIGYWNLPKDWVSWDLVAEKKGVYDVTVETSSEQACSEFSVTVGDHTLHAASRVTSSWSNFVSYQIGQIELKKPGTYRLELKPGSPESWRALGLLRVTLHRRTGHRKSYEANWDSLDARRNPRWFSDAKFGVFVCWGLYSVPAWTPKGKYAEWYQYWLQQKAFDGQVHDFHARTYGEGFQFADFAPLFKAELWDPNEWADLFDRAGAKYIVFTTKHHSGYTMWPSREAERTYGANYNPVKVGPGRDIVGDLATAIRPKGIRLGLYYSLYEWYHPLWKSDKARFVAEHFFPQFKDLVTRYQPDLIWADGEWSLPWEQWRSPELLAWLFNNASNESDLVINDRWGKGVRHKHGGFYTTEYGSGMDDDSHPWEEDRGMGHSYGYNRAEDLEDYRSAQELILMLIDVVSRGGNLCLDVGPRADGKIPVIMQERLLQIGAWLKTNGEAIYGTRMWDRPCQWSGGKVPELKRGEYMSKFNILEQTVAPPDGQAFKEAWFTCKDGNLYVITPRWPGATLRLRDVRPGRATEVTFLATGEQLSWTRRGKDMVINLPEFDANATTSRYAYAFRLSDMP